MKKSILFRLSVWSALLVASIAGAETLYITDQVHIGLHEEKSFDSPIVKILATGTPLEIIKREDALFFVRDQQGSSGWIDSRYLIQNDPSAGQSQSLAKQVEQLNLQLTEADQRIKDLQAGTDKTPDSYQALQKDHAILQQQYKSEKIKVGELQVQLAELRKRIGQDNDKDSLYKQIEQLREKNKNLEVKLLGLQEENAVANDVSDASSVADDKYGITMEWKNLFTYISFTLVIGIGIGLYFMDYLNRRRHGGFRV